MLRAWGPAHTTSDQTAFIDGKVLFGGHLVETNMFPIAPYFPPYHTDVDGHHWIDVLDQLLALDPTVVVPGHGEVAGVALIRDVRDYLAHIRDETARLRVRGASVDEAVATIDEDARARWSTWANPEWISFAARAFYDAS